MGKWKALPSELEKKSNKYVEHILSRYYIESANDRRKFWGKK